MSSRDLNRELWKAYEGVVPTGSATPLAFIVRAKTDRDATQLRDRFTSQHCEFVWLERKWWRFLRPWELALKSVPLAYTPDSLDSWTDAVDREVLPLGAELAHWVPVRAGG